MALRVTWPAISPVSDSSSLLLDSMHLVRFLPGANFNGNVSFAFRAWDKTSGIAGTRVDTSTNGGTTAFSSAFDIATITVNPVDDAPILSWPTPSDGSLATFNVGDPQVIVAPAITIEDIDSSTMSSATVNLASGFVKGEDYLYFTDQNGITGTYDANTGILTLNGVADKENYQLALRSVRYQNANGDAASGRRTIAFIVNDGEKNSNAVTRDISVVPHPTPAAEACPILDCLVLKYLLPIGAPSLAAIATVAGWWYKHHSDERKRNGESRIANLVRKRLGLSNVDDFKEGEGERFKTCIQTVTEPMTGSEERIAEQVTANLRSHIEHKDEMFHDRCCFFACGRTVRLGRKPDETEFEEKCKKSWSELHPEEAERMRSERIQRQKSKRESMRGEDRAKITPKTGILASHAECELEGVPSSNVQSKP